MVGTDLRIHPGNPIGGVEQSIAIGILTDRKRILTAAAIRS